MVAVTCSTSRASTAVSSPTLGCLVLQDVFMRVQSADMYGNLQTRHSEEGGLMRLSKPNGLQSLTQQPKHVWEASTDKL